LAYTSVSGGWRKRFAHLAILAALFAALSAALAGCSGNPKDVLTPVADTSPNSSRVDMLIATTRARSENTGEMYTGERAPLASFAEIIVSIPPGNARKVGEVSWPKKLPSNPQTDFATLKADQVDVEAAKAWLKTSVVKSPDRSVLVFIHGFNNRFEDSVYRFAQIIHDSNVRSAPILVTWPSRGSVLAYGYDRESTNYTRNALEKLFQYLKDDPEIQEVNILAHSMGNWLTLEALRQMAIRNDGLPHKFKNVMLAAPDVDVDVFRSQIADMGTPHPQFTLFVSRDDRALAVSRRVWGDVERLGSIDPEKEPYKQELADNKISVVDLTKMKAMDSLHHGKFAESPEIVQLIGTRMSDGQTLTDSRVSVGDKILAGTTKAALVAGSTTGLVLSAPVAVVDPVTRNNYSNQVTDLTGDAEALPECQPDVPAQNCRAVQSSNR
jgi:esterase/lipase superfamily enzyme